jgi:hypothetical protein
MVSPTQRQATRALFVAALLLCAPAHAALVVGADGKPIRRATGRALVFGEVRDGACKVPPPNAVVVFNLARETKLVDAIAWISPVICRPFLVRDTTVAADKRLTMVAPERMTPNEAMRLFLGALDSVGLTLERSGRFLRVYEVSTRHRRIVEDGTVAPEPYVTALVRVQDLPPDEQERLLRERSGGVCHGDIFAPAPETVVITDLRSNIERILGHPIGR